MKNIFLKIKSCATHSLGLVLYSFVYLVFFILIGLGFVFHFFIDSIYGINIYKRQENK